MATMPSPEEFAILALDNRQANIVAALVSACIISAVTVGLRCYVRILKLGIFGLDDYFMVAAQMFGIGMAVTLGLEVKGGLGRHIMVLTADERLLYFQSFYASILIYNTAITIVKISILLQYRRIFQSHWFQHAALSLLIFFVTWGIAVLIWLGVLCIPVDRFWDPTVPGRCLPLLPAFYVPSGMNIATDFAIFLLPLPVLRTIQLPRKQKIVLYGIFGVGLFTCTLSIIRLYTLKIAAESQDSTWDTVDAAIWSYVEICMAITVGSLPTLRPLVARYLPASLNASRPSQDHRRYYISGHSSTTGAVRAGGQDLQKDPIPGFYTRFGDGGTGNSSDSKMGEGSDAGSGSGTGGGESCKMSRVSSSITAVDPIRTNILDSRSDSGGIDVEMGRRAESSRSRSFGVEDTDTIGSRDITSTDELHRRQNGFNIV